VASAEDPARLTNSGEADSTVEPPGAAVEKDIAAASPEAKKPGSGNYLVVPITTNLQRAHGIKYKDAQVFVLINGMAVLNENDTTLDMGAVDFYGIQDELAHFYPADSRPRGSAIFHVGSGFLLPSPKHVMWGASMAFGAVLRDMARPWVDEFAVELVRHSDWKDANHWESLVADLSRPPSEEAIKAEEGVGDEQVRLYAVHTPLSRFLYGEDIDCVIHIIPPIQEADAGVVLTMQRCLPKLKLAKKGSVQLLYHWKKGNLREVNLAREELFGEHIYRDLLGFKSRGQCLWSKE